MRVLKSIYLGIFLFIVSCTASKTTKVYIEVGVNDYSKTGSISSSSGYTKTKKLDSGAHPTHAVDTNSHSNTSKKAPR